MSCNRYRFDMSLNLDGRLPSGRREVLMSHLAECADCSRLWDEMQRAQELALSLPGEQTGSDFSDSLWNRIRAGEGTPDAVYLEPMPLGRKIRYLATGAAAAAAVLIGLQTWNDATAIDAPPADTNAIASAEQDPEERHGLTAVGSGLPAETDFAFRPLDPPAIAQASHATVVDSIYALQSEAQRFDVDVKLEPRAIRARLDESVDRLRSVTRLMFWLEEEKVIELPGDFQSELEHTNRLVRRLDDALETREFAATLREIREIDVSRIHKPFKLFCCDFPADFQFKFRDHFQRNPEIRRALRLEVVTGGDLHVSGNPQWVVVLKGNVPNRVQLVERSKRKLEPKPDAK